MATRVAVFGAGFEFAQPEGFTCATHARFIRMQHGGLAQCAGDLRDGWLHLCGAFDHAAYDASGAGPVAEEVFTHLRGALVGQQLPVLQTAHHRLHVGAAWARSRLRGTRR